MTNTNIYVQECTEDDDFLEVPRSDTAFKALKFVPWYNPNCQFCFFVNAQYWMPFARVFVQPNKWKSGLRVVMIGKDLNWRTICHITKPDISASN